MVAALRGAITTTREAANNPQHRQRRHAGFAEMDRLAQGIAGLQEARQPLSASVWITETSSPGRAS